MNIKEETRLAADALHTDPRVRKAKQLLQEAVNEHKSRLTGVRPADPNLAADYSAMLADFGQLRSGKLWYPYVGSGIGNGCLVELADGSVKYDMIGGIGVHYFGHNHPDIISSSIDGALDDTILQGHLMQNRESYQLCKKLTSLSGLDHCFLTTSGVMANENALKMAFQKRNPAHRVLAFNRNFSGRTITLAQVTDKPTYRAGLPAALHVDYLPFYDPARPNESTAETVRVLKEIFKRYPGQHAAIIMELVQGEGGFYPGSPEFFKTVCKMVKEQGIYVIMDEVQTFGRTPRLFAFQHFGLEQYADLVTIGKLSQTCATLFKTELKPQAGLLSQTFTSTTVAIRGALTIIDQLVEGNYFGERGRLNQIQARFARRLQEAHDRHPDLISGPYGIGAMVAFTPYGGDNAKVSDYTHRLFQAGVIGFTTGTEPTRVRFLVPALVITDDDIDAVCRIVEETLLVG